jgi:Tfp pilus assembly protein PilF
VESLERFGIGTRIENTILSYVNYPGKFFWPTDLAMLYPYPRSFDVLQVLPAALLLLAISGLCILQMRRRPYLAAGWFWYLVMMAPVIGLVQIGLQSMADRHTYLSMVGPTMSLVWLVGEWAGTNWFRKGLAGCLAVAALAGCVILTGKQLSLWRDTDTLFEHTLAVTAENGVAEYPLALGLEHDGLFRQAAIQYRIALTLPPDNLHYEANFYLAEIMARLGQNREAVARLNTALELKPDSADAMNNLAWILSTCPDANIRDGPRAAQLAQRACELTHYQAIPLITTLAAAYAEEGDFDKAIATTQQAIALAQQQGNAQMDDANEELLQVYSNHQTYSEAHPSPPGN